MKLHLLFSLILLSFSANTLGGQFVLLNEQEIKLVKLAIADGSASDRTKEVYNRLLKRADKLLTVPNYTVVDKTIIPPGATANDFVSISSYWWPDTKKAGGLPWVRIEGKTNPDTKTDKVDRNRVNDMAKAVYTLSQAYYFSGNVEYAKKAITMIKVWFLANKTRMTPHLQYAQTSPGLNERVSSGIMDGRLIPHNILDSINLIRNSGYWSERFDAVMNQWLATYLKWLTGSEMGRKASEKKDRHGSWYYYQTSALSWYLNDQKTLSRQFKLAKNMMKKQFNKEGGLILELDRSKSYSDSCFSLSGLTAIAVIAEKAGKKFWDLPSQKKSSIAKGIEYMKPATINGEWAHSDESIDVKDCADAFSRYAEYSKSAQLKATVSTLLDEIEVKTKKSSDDKRFLIRHTLLKQQ